MKKHFKSLPSTGIVEVERTQLLAALDAARPAWTEFVEVEREDDRLSREHWPAATYRNSRYQVSIYYQRDLTFGHYAHLSIKTHDKCHTHDWRDLQRIKNELLGEEREAVELYPAESRLVDSANQYHLFVFMDYKFPFGFKQRMVMAETQMEGARQRPFEQTPKSMTTQAEFDALMAKARPK